MTIEVTKIAALGEVLVRDGLINHITLKAALDEQKECGSRLGSILIGKGFINNLKLYEAVAKHYNLPFANLRKFLPDVSLLRSTERENYLKLGVVPWKQENGIVTYAVTDLSLPVLEWIAEQGSDDYMVAITSPLDITYTVQHYFYAQDDEEAREILWQYSPETSAKHLFKTIESKIRAFLVCAACIVMLLLGNVALYAFIAMSVFYAATLVFKTLLLCAGVKKPKKLPAKRREEKSLPVYTILVPLYKEARVLHQLVQAIRHLDYPKSKLDVKLVVEEGDEVTIEAIKALRCESYFEIIRVPYSLPQTKPKACNYALKFARGEYITIYDAEDIPHPLQLRKVIATFDSDPAIVCVQAKLNYYNRRENLLTRMFALEYGMWFDIFLQGLERLKLPIPLGGTSNHIRLEVLRDLHAWDPYNVTEDADLGIRLAANGHKTKMVDSLTLEEAPIAPRGWIGQRSRWIKGYMQTYLVYMRHPLALFNKLGLRGFLGFQLFIGAPCLVFLFNPVMWGAWLAIFLYSWDKLYGIDPAITTLFAFNLAVGFGLQLAMALMVVIRHKWWDMLAYLPLYVPYWALHSFASLKAVWQLIVKPHWWEKTNHGLSRYIDNVRKAA